jgi:antitoxin component of RelBE/YafQ-DinJ toxin-antitoxin module
MAESGLRIRIDDDLRTQFIQACRDNDLTAAQVLRAFMRQYVHKGGHPAAPNQLGNRATPSLKNYE